MIQIIDRLEPKPLSEDALSKYLRAFVGGPSKVGKTTTLVTFWDGKAGPVVDKPSHIHIVSCDPGGLRSLRDPAVTKEHPWLISDPPSVYTQFEELANGQGEPLYERLSELLDYLGAKSRSGQMGTSALFVSGAGALMLGLQRQVRYTIGSAPSDGMEGAYGLRWTVYGNRIDNIRAKIHGLKMHVAWEFTVMKLTDEGDETHTIQGKQGSLFAAGLEQALKVEPRLGGGRGFDTRPKWPFMGTSRSESVLPQKMDADFSQVCKLYGLTMVGGKT